DVPLDVTSRYLIPGSAFDAQVATAERVTGILALRRKLAGRARGHVLESAAGSGRNTAFYAADELRSATFVELSAPMLDAARAKWRAARPAVAHARFLARSVLGPDPREAERYDTVVQTMGLCSTPEPDRLLRRLGELVRRDGQILLLEHGRGWWGWLNRWLDVSAPGHADRFGCWWNRDIGAIVERSGLEVVEARRPWRQLGTTWFLVLR
ncbi:S-adenosyl-L-methionine-dependent methyltransferase, partial [Lineolata rhizophorae]